MHLRRLCRKYMFRWADGIAVIGAARAQNSAKVGQTIAAASIDHLHRYIELLFQPAKRNRKETL